MSNERECGVPVYDPRAEKYVPCRAPDGHPGSRAGEHEGGWQMFAGSSVREWVAPKGELGAEA